MLAEVQVLRAVAALLVFASHLSQHLTVHLGLGTPVLHVGAAGVDVFFVISGFIMVWTSRHAFGQSGVRAKFVQRRLIRIVPLYWLVTGAFLAAMVVRLILMPEAVRFDFDPYRIAASFLFVPWPDAMGVHLPVFSPGWTLNYEMFFYTVFALLLGLGVGRAVVALTLLFGSLAVLGRVSDAWPFAARVWSDPIILEFVAGAWIAFARIRGLALAPALRLCLVAAGMVALAATQWVLAEEAAAERLLFWGIPAALVVAGLTLGGPWPRRPGPATHIMVVLGDASYAIYLVHAFVIFAIRPVAVPMRELIVLSPLAYASVVALVALGASLAVHLLVERPIHQWLLERYAGRAPRRATTEAAGASAPATLSG